VISKIKIFFNIIIADDKVTVAYLENAFQVTVNKLVTFIYKFGLKVSEIQRKQWLSKDKIQ